MKNWVNIPNTLSLSRLVFLPLLYIFLWKEQITTFFVSFSILGSTDFFDGYLARKWNQVTRLGKNLDTIADMFFYISVAYFLWVLSPEAIITNRPLLIVTFSVYALTFLVPLIKFKKAYTIHTRLLKSNAFFVYIMMILSSIMSTTFILSVILIIFLIGFLEEILIFIKFGEVDQDTSSYFNASKSKELLEILLETKQMLNPLDKKTQ
jgi:phosphatidylglycerophosphate synthase